MLWWHLEIFGLLVDNIKCERIFIYLLSSTFDLVIVVRLTFHYSGTAYCVVHLVSLVGFCICKKYGLEKSLFWSRVSVFPVLFILFVCAGISSTNDDSVYLTDIQYPLQFSVTVIGYIWHLLLFGVFLYTKCRCICDHSKADQSMSDLFKKSDVQI